MADQKAPQMQATLGLTGLTSNAMALIAPGAFLWLTFFIQATTGVRPALNGARDVDRASLLRLLLCLATAVAYAEISKLYPGTGSSYYYAEQAMLSKDKAFKYARIAKFIVGWGSHLYYWVYPGVMVASNRHLRRLRGRLPLPELHQRLQPRAGLHGPGRGCLLVLRGVDRPEGRGRFDRRQPRHQRRADLRAGGLQRSRARLSRQPSGRHRPPSSTTASRSPPTPTSSPPPKTAPSSATRAALLCRCSTPPASRFRSRLTTRPPTPTATCSRTPSAKSVVVPHNFNWMFIQATVAILILVGFESVTAMGGEAKNPTKHIPIAVIASLLIQGLVCYLIEYFAANYFLNSGYTMQSAAGSAAPIGDMMIIVGDALLGQGHGKYFMLAEAFTVFLALIGTTLSCMNTGARVTYAMGKDDEAPEHFGILHAESLTPRRAIWTLAVISAILGCIAVSLVFADASAPSDATIAALPARHLLQLRLLHARQAGGTAQLAADHHPHIQLRHVHPVRAELLPVHRGVSQAARPQLRRAHTDPRLRPAGEPGLHGVLRGRSILQSRHQDGAAAALGISAVWGLYGAVYFLRLKAKGKAFC